MVLKYIPISEFVAAALIGSQVSADASFWVWAVYQHRRDTIWSWWLFVNICKISVRKSGRNLSNLKYSASTAEAGAET